MEYRHCHKKQAHNRAFQYGTDNGRRMLSTGCDGRTLFDNTGGTTDDECYRQVFTGLNPNRQVSPATSCFTGKQSKVKCGFV